MNEDILKCYKIQSAEVCANQTNDKGKKICQWLETQESKNCVPKLTSAKKAFAVIAKPVARWPIAIGMGILFLLLAFLLTKSELQYYLQIINQPDYTCYGVISMIIMSIIYIIILRVILILL